MKASLPFFFLSLFFAGLPNFFANAQEIKKEANPWAYHQTLSTPLSGGLTHINRDSFNKGHIFDFWQLVQGRVPGLTLARPGSDPLARFEVQSRGLHSAIYPPDPRFPLDRAINLHEPLYVIDGFAGASPKGIDPADIASITVLRSAAATALYGARGANGVVIIETLKPKEGKPVLEYETYLAMDRSTRLPEVLDGDAFAQLTGTDLGARTDWMDEISRTGWSQLHHLSLSGGANNTRYQGSVNFRDVNGVALNSGFGQWNAQLGVQQRFLAQKLELGARLAATQRNFQSIDPLAFRQAAIYNPTAPVKGDNLPGTGGYFQEPLFLYYNPVAMVEQNRREGDEQVYTAQVNARLRLMDGLSINARYGFQRNQSFQGAIDPADAFYQGRDQGGILQTQDRRLDNQLGELTAAYERRLGLAHLHLFMGYAYQRYDLSGENLRGTNFSGAAFSFRDFDLAANQTITRFRGLDEQLAFFGGAQYTYDSTYFLTATLRREGASRFGPERKWAIFPAVQSAVALHRLLDWKNPLHVRLAYGEAGQLPPKAYAAFRRLSPSGDVFYNNRFIPIYAPENEPNPSIGVERRREWNFGADISLWENRLQLRVDYYNSRSGDLIYPDLLNSPPALAREALVNFGELRNRGLEASLDWKAVQKNDFSWTSSIIASTNQTTLVSLSSPSGYSYNGREMGNFGGPGLCCATATRLQEGEAVGRFYGPVFSRIDENGRWEFETINHSGGGQEARIADIGGAQPVLSLGWNNRLSAGRWGLDWLLRGVFGHDLISTYQLIYGVYLPGFTRYNVPETALEGELDRLTEPNRFSSYSVENASFLRLEYISLSYRFPMAESRSLEAYLGAQHLFTWTGYSDADPELRLRPAGNPLAPGIDSPNGFSVSDLYFPARSLLLGLRLNW